MAVAFFTGTLYRATTAQGRLAQQSIDLMRKDVEATHRPWIQILQPRAASPLIFIEEGAALEIVFEYKNIGSGIAFKVNVQVVGFVPVTGKISIPDELAALRSKIRGGADGLKGGDILFPGDKSPYGTIVTFKRGDIDAAVARMGKSVFTGFFFVCIDYADGTTGKEHFTANTYVILSELETENSMGTSFGAELGSVIEFCSSIELDRSAVPERELVIRRFPYGSRAE